MGGARWDFTIRQGQFVLIFLATLGAFAWAYGVSDSRVSFPAGAEIRPADSIAYTLDFETASAVALAELPRVGPTLALTIVNYRDRLAARGESITTKSQLLDIPGIGPAALERISPYLTLSAEKTTQRP